SNDVWETKFFDKIEQLPPSENKSSVPELLYGFFKFYSEEFDWTQSAVCIRASNPVNKYHLHTNSYPEQWYIEDPFDLKHNLGAKCSRQGKEYILQ
ncbi:TUT7, partial [Symbiodinium pilosum]